MKLKQPANPERGPAPRKSSARNAAILASFAAALTTLSAPISASAQISLGTVVEMAQRNSSEVKLAGADLQKAYAVLAQAKDVYIPNVVVGSSIGPPSIGFPSGQPSIANASMQSLAFSFPQRQYIRAAQSGIEAATLNLKEAREQVALDASTAYIELDTVTQELNAAHEQAAFSSRLVEIEQQRTDAGVDPRSEWLQARLTAAELNLKFLHLQQRIQTLSAQLAALTGLPAASILADHASIPEIPAIKTAEVPVMTAGVQSAQAEALSRQLQAHGDDLEAKKLPVIGFGAQYNRDSTLLNNYKYYYAHFKADNFSAGLSIQIPIFDRSRRAKARQTEAEALRATVEAEQAQRQSDVQIATLTGSLRELDAVAEVASLKQQIAAEQLKTVQAELETGNGAGSDPGAPAQLSPKAEQLARIDERQKFVDALDAGFDLTKTRLTLLRALGHMEDWLSEIHAGVQPKEPATATH